jgi:hypothetical protein
MYPPLSTTPLDCLHRWLLSAAANRQAAMGAWDRKEPASLRTGRIFDAVEIQGPLHQYVHAALVGGPAGFRRGPYLASRSMGPGWWLVPVGTAETWAPRVPPDVSVHGAGGVIDVPMTRAPGAVEWVEPPHCVRDLAEPTQLARAIRVARDYQARRFPRQPRSAGVTA